MSLIDLDQIVIKHITKRINKHLDEIHALIDILNSPKKRLDYAYTLVGGKITPIKLDGEEK